MPNRYTYLGFIKLNCEEDGDNYLSGDYLAFELPSFKNRQLMIDKDGDICNTNTRKKYYIRKHPHGFNSYDLDSKEYGIGYTKNGSIFFFDKEDFPLISQYTWTNDARGYMTTSYCDDNGKRCFIKMHRLVLGVTDPKISVDHIHHNHADNRKSELRIVSQQENIYNSQIRKDNKSGHTGVHYDAAHGKWRARIEVNGKRIHLGFFLNEADAISARKNAEEIYFGKYRYQGTLNNDQILKLNKT